MIIAERTQRRDSGVSSQLGHAFSISPVVVAKSIMVFVVINGLLRESQYTPVELFSKPLAFQPREFCF